jgi:hypothetical protein
MLAGLRLLLGASAAEQESPYPSVVIEADAQAKTLTLIIRDPHKDLTGLRLVYAAYTEKGRDQLMLKQRGTSISTDKHTFSFELDVPVSPSTFDFELGLGNLDLSGQFDYTAVSRSQSKAGKWIPLD